MARRREVAGAVGVLEPRAHEQHRARAERGPPRDGQAHHHHERHRQRTGAELGLLDLAHDQRDGRGEHHAERELEPGIRSALVAQDAHGAQRHTTHPPQGSLRHRGCQIVRPACPARSEPGTRPSLASLQTPCLRIPGSFVACGGGIVAWPRWPRSSSCSSIAVGAGGLDLQPASAASGYDADTETSIADIQSYWGDAMPAVYGRKYTRDSRHPHLPVLGRQSAAGVRWAGPHPVRGSRRQRLLLRRG